MEFNEVRKVVLFQLTDAKTQQEKNLLPTTCYMTQDGDLVSCETGIKYELSADHLTVIYRDWQAKSMSRSLFDDYLLQTSLQQTNNNFVRIGINYDEIEPGQNDEITEFLWDKVLVKRKMQTSSKKQICSIPIIALITKTIYNSKIEAFTIVDPHYPKRRYIQALLQGKKIIISGEKPYNNEGVIYCGESEMDERTISEMQKHLKLEIRCRGYSASRDLTLWYVTLALHENVSINVLIKIEENDQGPFNFLFDKELEKEAVQQKEIEKVTEDQVKALPQEETMPEPEQQGNHQQIKQQESTMNLLKSEKEESHMGEKITQDAPQGTWSQLLLPCGIVFCVVVFLVYRYKNA